MRRDSTIGSAIWILAILSCPILVIFPLLAIVWILAPYFIEQWKEDWKTVRERRRTEKEMKKRGEPLRPLKAVDRREALQKIQKKYNLTKDEMAFFKSMIRPME